MARVNVYLPDDLAESGRAAGLNVSSGAQEALREQLAAQGTTTWLDRLGGLQGLDVTHEQVMVAIDQVRAEQGDDWPGAHSRSAPR